MKPINVTVNAKRNGFHIPSDFNKGKLNEWMKKYRWFQILPLVEDSSNGRRYLEGAIIPEYCWHQYGIDPRDPYMDEARRFLFKRDFCYRIIDDRNGTPTRIPVSTVGKVNEVTQRYNDWADENGGKKPNADLYKLWRDKYRTNDHRFPTFHDFLTFLKLDCDAMPSAQTLSVLDEKDEKKPQYPEYNGKPTI